MPLEFVKKFHLDIRVSWKSFEALIFIIAWSQAVRGDYSVRLFSYSHSNLDLPLIQAFENYLGFPLPYRQICELFPFVISTNTGQSRTSENLYLFCGVTQQYYRVVGARNPASAIFSRGSFFTRRSLHLEPVIHTSSVFGNATFVPPDPLPSPPALKIGKFFTSAYKSIF